MANDCIGSLTQTTEQQYHIYRGWCSYTYVTNFNYLFERFSKAPVINLDLFCFGRGAQ